MPSATFSESREIAARPIAIYDLLIDYHEGHVSILPQPYFKDLRVLEGGIGAGTVFEADMAVFGIQRTLRMHVEEIEPGRRFRETDSATGTVTDFIIDPIAGGARLTLQTTMVFSDGLAGWVEKLTTPSITRMIYRKELALIAETLESMTAPA